jgi:hypothetical protein
VSGGRKGNMAIAVLSNLHDGQACNRYWKSKGFERKNSLLAEFIVKFANFKMLKRRTYRFCSTIYPSRLGDEFINWTVQLVSVDFIIIFDFCVFVTNNFGDHGVLLLQYQVFLFFERIAAHLLRQAHI